MKRPPKTPVKSLGPAVLAALVVLTAAALYSTTLRSLTFEREFAYLPRGSVLALATGDPKTIWSMGEAHLKPYLNGEDPTAIQSGLEAFSEFVDDLDIGFNITSYDDLQAYGLNPNRGILFSLFRAEHGGRDSFLFVLPVSSPKAFVKRAAEALGDPIDETSPGVVGIGDWRFAQPEPGIGVWTNSEHLLAQSLGAPTENLRAALNNDSLYGSVRRLLRRPLLTGSSSFLHLQTRAAPFGEVAAVVDLDPERLQLKADVLLTGATLRVLKDVVAPPPEPRIPWVDSLPPDPVFTLAVRDLQLPRYVRLLADFGALDETPDTELLKRLARNSEVVQGVFAITSFEDWLPTMVLGLWGNPEALKEIQLAVRQRWKLERDRDLLQSVLASAQGGASAEEVVAALLAVEPGDSLGRYPIEEGTVRNIELTAEDFPTEVYEREFHGSTIRFLAPRLTKNDLDHRAEFKDSDEATLLSDDYRVASVIHDGALWLATDVKELEAIVLRSQGVEVNDHKAIRKAPHQDSEAILNTTKLKVDFDASKLITSGLLALDTEGSEITEALVANLANHPRFSLEATPTDRGRRFQVMLTIERESP